MDEKALHLPQTTGFKRQSNFFLNDIQLKFILQLLISCNPLRTIPSQKRILQYPIKKGRKGWQMSVFHSSQWLIYIRNFSVDKNRFCYFCFSNQKISLGTFVRCNLFLMRYRFLLCSRILFENEENQINKREK